MSRHRGHTGKVDANQRAIVEALRKVGCIVTSTASVGDGAGDVVVASPFTGRMFWLEIKDGAKPPSARRLTEKEVAFAAKWAGHYFVVESAEQAIAIVRGETSGGGGESDPCSTDRVAPRPVSASFSSPSSGAPGLEGATSGPGAARLPVERERKATKSRSPQKLDASPEG